MMVLIATRREQQLTKACPLAHYESVKLVTSPDVEKPQVKDTTPKFQDAMAAARPDLSDAESKALEELLIEYADIFAMKSDNYGWTDRLYHSIDTGEARPICQHSEEAFPTKTGRNRRDPRRHTRSLAYRKIETATGHPPSFHSEEEWGPAYLRKLQCHKEGLFPTAQD